MALRQFIQIEREAIHWRENALVSLDVAAFVGVVDRAAALRDYQVVEMVKEMFGVMPGAQPRALHERAPVLNGMNG